MEQTNNNYLSTLTPLRGLAALMVAIYHFEDVVARFISPEQTMFIRKAYLMVDLFFVLSGFIMLHVYGNTFEKGLTRVGVGNFLAARFARIYPLHLFSLLLLVGVFYASHAQPDPINDPAAIPSHLLLLHSFGVHPIFTWNVPSWSISAEWWAYLVFPLLVILLSRYKIVANIGMVMFAGILYLSIVFLLPRTNFFAPGVPAPQDLNVTYDYGFLRGLAGFVVGMLTYELFTLISLRQLFSRDLTALLFMGGTVFLLHLGVNDLLYIPAFAGLVLCLASNNAKMKSFLNIGPLQFLGNISYSIYLMHGLLLFWVAAPILVLNGYAYKGPGSLTISLSSGLLYCGIYLLAVLGVSTLTYYAIEKPCRNWINYKWARREKVPSLI
ncbi:MAG: acyltransferase [Bacteroidota bacterium]|nr:acyltransferase [Bacteroidota bacterium]